MKQAMQINLGGLTIQCMPGNLSEQSDIDALIVFADFSLRPLGRSSGQVYNAAGERLENSLLQAGPRHPGSILCTHAHSVAKGAIIHCIIKEDFTTDILRQACITAFSRVNAAGHRTLALAPLESNEFPSDEPEHPSAMLAGLDRIPAASRSIELVRIIVPEEISHAQYSIHVARAVSQLNLEL